MQSFTGLEYLYIDIANQYGWDKSEWLDRIRWVLNRKDDLEQFTDEADDPLLYIKAVKTLRETQEGKWTGFIMGLDATASGLQIMAALIGCHTTARNVNLINTGKREEIYGKVASDMCSLGVKVDRAMVKKPVMTTFYGSKHQPKQLFGEDTPELQAFYDVLHKELPGAMEVMEDMQGCWNPDALVHMWTLPDGHKVMAKVMEAEDKRIEVDELGHSTFTHRAYVNTSMPYGLSLAANIVHSIDGWIVREMVRRTNKAGVQMAAIHDSFWAHPNDMNLVRQSYINIMAEIADSDMLQGILREITGNPGLGFVKLSDDLGKEIRNSEYALS